MTGFPIEYWSIGGILKGVGGYVVSKVPVTWGGGGEVGRVSECVSLWRFWNLNLLKWLSNH